MAIQTQKQTEQPPFALTVDVTEQTREYWLERFRIALKRFDSFAQMADEMALLDPEFAHAAGVLHLQRIHVGRGKLIQTAKAAQMLEQLRPAPLESSSLLKRQKLNRG